MSRVGSYVDFSQIISGEVFRLFGGYYAFRKGKYYRSAISSSPKGYALGEELTESFPETGKNQRVQIVGKIR